MPPTILVVEDMDLCRDALEVVLIGLRDTEVHSVETAEEALRSFHGDICALVTDLRLTSRAGSAMDGFDLIAVLRATERWAALPIVVISGDSDPAIAARLADLGVNAFFPKPYSPAAVRSKLEQLILAAEEPPFTAPAGESDRGLPRAAYHPPSTASSIPPD